ncbi:hypothetical protein [Mycoplasma phocimorsus]|uniref:hypothetical protein n=1 Tax=Mycoplasma phocimorsus TaxID=3045839 RepID=UPI0024C02DF1|nr:hypothetical protein [Mycoplasma phocimorsus]MDJ1647261.1 hypothetical protein [Mycoplasma phocimorsus]
MIKINKLAFLFLKIIGITTIISCNSNINNHKAQKIISKKLINQKNDISKIVDKQKSISLLLNSNNEKYIPFIIDSNLIEDNNLKNIKENQLKFNVNTILQTKKIFNIWNKKTKHKLKIKKELETLKKREKSYVMVRKTAMSLLLAGGILSVGIYFFKYNRDPLHKTKAYFTNFIFKKYLKHINVDINFEDIFKNLMFYLFKENDFEDRKLISFLIWKVKEVIFDKKDIKSIFNEEQINNWIKEFSKNENNNTSIKNNPISYFIKILNNENGEKILKEFLKLLTKIFENKEKININSDFNNYLFKKTENTEGILSNFASIFAGLSTVKNGVEFITTYGKTFLDKEKEGLLTVWTQFINILRNIINKNNFKEQYKKELEILYNLFYNVIEWIFKDLQLEIKEPIKDNGFFSLISLVINNFVVKTFKITDIVTPQTIKEWIEDNRDNKQIVKKQAQS